MNFYAAVACHHSRDRRIETHSNPCAISTHSKQSTSSMPDNCPECHNWVSFSRPLATRQQVQHDPKQSIHSRQAGQSTGKPHSSLLGASYEVKHAKLGRACTAGKACTAGQTMYSRAQHALQGRPGGPYSSTPDLCRSPAAKREGCFNGSSIVSRIARFTFSKPPTSSHRTSGTCTASHVTWSTTWLDILSM